MFKAKLLTPDIDYKTGQVILKAAIVEGNYREFYDKADKDKLFSLSVKRHFNRRSLDANAYFHVLCGKIAEKVGSSMIEVKNMMIARYGQAEILEDGSLDYMIVRDEINVLKFEELHLQATAQTQTLNGKLYRVYIRMRNTGWNKGNGYTTAEMSRLIDGTISEAREIGLPESEIMSTRDKKIIKEVYGID